MRELKKYYLFGIILLICLIAFFPVSGWAMWYPGGPGGGRPSPPTLYAIPSPANEAQLSWSSAPRATSYKIYRNNAQSGIYSYIASTTTRSYTDHPPSSGTWWYKIKGCNSYGDSSFSNERSVDILPYPIEIISPQEQTYTDAMEGYYSGTYSFENDEDYVVPSEWTDSSTGTCSATVMPTCNNHIKVLNLYDADEENTYAQIKINFDESRYWGIIEFWFQMSETLYNSYFILRDGDNELIQIKQCAGNWEYFDGIRWNSIPGISTSCLDCVWYRIQIHFKYNEWSFEINDDVSKKIEFDNTGIENLVFKTEGYGNRLYNIYIDAVGFSWDENYTSEDNKYEGIFLDLSLISDNFEWLGYSLDGGENITISGDIVLPMLKSGIHTIQVFGEDSQGFPHQSSIRIFNIDVFDKVGVFFFSSDCGSKSGDTTNSEHAEGNIHIYKEVLMGENYNKFYIYRDLLSSSKDEVMDRMVKFRIDYQDIVFFYIWGHGEYNAVKKNDDIETYSKVWHSEYGGTIDSKEFKSVCDLIDSTKIGLLVEACYSGGFYYDFYFQETCFVITSTETYREGTQGGFMGIAEGVFSHYFWNYVTSGYDAEQSFNYAKIDTHSFCDKFGVEHQEPLRKDHPTYTFFAN